MKKDLTLPTLASLVALLAFSSVGATYAWYQYNANVIIDYNGTSIGSSTVFEVGLVSETPLVGYEDYGLVREEIDGKDVYWCSSEVTTNISDYYLKSNGYSSNYLNAVTSGKYIEGDSIALKRDPRYSDNYVLEFSDEKYDYAEKANYVHFSLVFKVNVITPDGDFVEESSKVTLKSADLDSDGSLKDSVRIHFSSEKSSFIFNPSSLDNGYDIVGGLLDLNNDGVYDCKNTRHGEYEIVYGEYESMNYLAEPCSSGVFGSVSSGDGNAFNAEHRQGAFVIDESSTVFCTSQYSGTSSVISSKKMLAETNSSGLAFMDVDIYCEGWSHAFVDAEMGHLFGLGLEFECK